MKETKIIDSLKTFFEEVYSFEKYRLIHWIPVCLGIGIYIYFSLSFEPIIHIGLIFCLIMFEARKIEASNIQKLFYNALFFIGIGFIAAQIRTEYINTYMLSSNIERPIVFSGVIEQCDKNDKGYVFVLNNITPNNYQINKIELYWRGKNAKQTDGFNFAPGNVIKCRAKITPINHKAFDGAYDFRKRKFFTQISARGFLLKKPEIINKSINLLEFPINKIRNFIDAKIEKALSQNNAGICKALITGNTSGISKDIRKQFSSSGIAHILAISGLHIGIIGLFILIFFRIFFCCIPKISMFYDVKKISAIFSLIGIFLYLYISGQSVPSTRAFIMQTIIIIAIFLERTALSMRTVAITAAIILIYSPEVLMFPSFQMSFGAVIAIIAFYEHTWNFSKFIKFLTTIFATTIVASIPTSIISINTFNQLTLNSIPANLLAIPMMTFFIMPLAVIALFFIKFNFSTYILLLLEYGIEMLQKITEYVSQLPGSYFVMPTPNTITMLILVFSFLVLTLMHHKIRFIGIVGCIIGCVNYYFTPIADIFVSPYSKVICIRTKDGVFLNHLGYFRNMTDSWSKSVGFDSKSKLNSSLSKKYFQKIDDEAYLANIKNHKILITSNEQNYDYLNPFLIIKMNYSAASDRVSELEQSLLEVVFFFIDFYQLVFYVFSNSLFAYISRRFHKVTLCP